MSVEQAILVLPDVGALLWKLTPAGRTAPPHATDAKLPPPHVFQGMSSCGRGASACGRRNVYAVVVAVAVAVWV
eukprot:6389123-Amphidinium_carterae.1